MDVLRFRWWLVPIGSGVTSVSISQIIINSQQEFVKYDLKIFPLTLNRAETRSGRVGTVSNGLETDFSSRISRRSRGAALQSDTWHNQRATHVQASRVEARVNGSLVLGSISVVSSDTVVRIDISR